MSRHVFKASRYCLLLAGLATALVMTADGANWLAGNDLLRALRQGGYVLVMRHASSPHATPTKAIADVENPNLERQLDDGGRNSALAMGEAIRRLQIPIGRVLVSPTYRARLTAKLAGFRAPQPVAELGDGGQSMQGADPGQANWLRAQIIQPPSQNTNAVIITHQPNIVAAFGKEWTDLAEGEAVVFHPDGNGSVIAVARIKIDDWPKLGSQ